MKIEFGLFDEEWAKYNLSILAQGYFKDKN